MPQTTAKTKQKQTINRLPVRAVPPPKAPWDSPVEEEAAQPLRGPAAIQHGKGSRGRRSAAFPDLNISQTALKLGITKSHLAKVLSGQNTPSLVLARKVAAILGTDLQFVASLSTLKKSAETQTPRKRAKHRKGK